MKKFLAMACFALVAGAASASAAVVLAPCPGNTHDALQLAELIRSNGCQQADKQYSGFTVEGLGATPLPTDWFVFMVENPAEFHSVNMNPGTQLIAPGSWAVAYDIAVDTAMAPNNYIVRVDVDSTLSGAGLATVTKTVKDMMGNVLGTVSSVNSAKGTLFLAPHTYQAIHVAEVISLPLGTGIQSFTDTYVQSQVPEPATYAMMGLGLAALGLISRRKKA